MKKAIPLTLLALLCFCIVAKLGAGVGGGSGGVGSSPGILFGSSGTLSGIFSPPLGPANGGVGAMTVPMYWHYLGDGSDGAGPASGSLSSTGNKYLTGLTCTGALTITGQGAVIRSTGAVNLNSGCTITATGSGQNGDVGGAGGSGGSEGAVNSVATLATAWQNLTNTAPLNYITSTAAAASSSSIGNNGGAISAATIRQILELGFGPQFRGGSPGSAGANSGGAAGNAGRAFGIVAPSITIASGVVLDASGAEGADSPGLTKGGGGPGGGGVIVLATPSLADNGGIYRYGGGPGGNCTAPSINATGGGCDAGTNGCGTGAVFTVTGVTAGGLDAAKITITAAGSGYQVAPVCTVNVNGSGLTGSPACHFTLSGGTIASVVIDTPGSGATFSDFSASCLRGGVGANGWMRELTSW